MTATFDLDGAFARTWDSLVDVGRHPATGGYRRYAWTDADLACRDWFRRQATDRGMAAEQDGNGNLWAWWGTPGPGAVVTGSHLDSVPDGGAFDGPLGIVSAFLAVDLLRADGFVPARPIAITSFTDEEGARFGIACVGTRLSTGLLGPDAARALRDRDGVSLEAAMRAAGEEPGALGPDAAALERIGCFVELHCEQGRGLVDLDAPVGVATAIWPHGRWRCSFHGEANHAGTTRLEDRRDPMLPFASTVLAARRAATAREALATFGRVVVEPNATNAVPSAVHAWLDSRAPDDATVQAVVAEVTAEAERAGVEHGVRVEVAAESYTPEQAFGDALRDRITGVLTTAGWRAPALPTGAGHDAGILSGFVPAAMLFVRNPTGVSHSPAEWCEAVDCVAGVEALAAVLRDLAGDDAPGSP